MTDKAALLTDADVWTDSGITSANAQCRLSMWQLITIARAVEAAVLRKLAEREPMAWMYEREGGDQNPYFMLAGHNADALRIGAWPLTPCPNHINWQPLYAAPVPKE